MGRVKIKTAVLCSGFGLGFYIPGIIIHNQLIEKGLESEVYVFESLLVENKKNNVSLNRKEYHKDFSVAKFAARMPFDIRESTDEALAKSLMNSWKKENIVNFISFSGHWGYILDDYQILIGKPINVDSMFIDRKYAPSWLGLKKYNPSYFERYNNVCFYDTEKDKINFIIRPNAKKVIPFSQRDSNSFVVHGGGWGMGTYQDIIPSLLNNNKNLHIVAYNHEDIDIESPLAKYYLSDPDWKCWEISSIKDYLFPPYLLFNKNQKNDYIYTTENHWLYDKVVSSQAIVSKPGAGTLMDSISSNTPVILLPPFGEHEKANYALWKSLGYGIAYETWSKSGYSADLLLTASQKIEEDNLKTPEYIENYVSRLKYRTIRE